MSSSSYRGRFAPSPTGPLHFGSLVSALASFLEARAHEGRWLLRIDDLDQTRKIDGMDSRIMRSLDSFGFEWDGPVAYQSQNLEHYQEAMHRLQRAGQTYACQCTRSQLRDRASVGIEGPIYPDTCRGQDLPDAKHRAIRIKTNDRPVRFCDRLFGEQTQCIHREIGDFVIRRADGYFAYQLAVTVDDELAQITDVVRGADLLTSTARQIHLQQLLGINPPTYLHVPLATDDQGRKLSKGDQAHPVDDATPVAALLDAWQFLNQATSPGASELSLADFWRWAMDHWNPESMPANTNIPL